MEKILMNQSLMEDIFKITAHVIKFPVKKIWIDYDDVADVLYISFQRPQKSTDSEMLNNGVLLRYRNDSLVGITILDASRRTST